MIILIKAKQYMYYRQLLLYVWVLMLGWQLRLCGGEMGDEPQRIIPLTVNLPVEWPANKLNQRRCLSVFDKNHEFVTDIWYQASKKTELILPKGLNEGVIGESGDGFSIFTDDDKRHFIHLKKPVEFTPDTKSLTFDFYYKKPIKFTITMKLPQGNPMPTDIRAFDVTGQKRGKVIMGLHRTDPLMPDAQRQVVFWGYPQRVYVLSCWYRDWSESVQMVSADFQGDGKRDEVVGDWEIPIRQLVTVTFMVVKENRYEPALDIKNIHLNNCVYYTVKDGKMYLNPRDAFIFGKQDGIATFELNRELRAQGYTKILKGAELKITPQTKEHVVLLSKDKFNADLAFAATDAANGEKIAASLYYAPASKDTEINYLSDTNKLILEPGKYRVGVAAPGYDMLPQLWTSKRAKPAPSVAHCGKAGR